MKDWNKQNLILLGILLAVGLTFFFTFILVGESDVKWAAPIPCAAIIYGLVVLVKKYWPMTQKPKKTE
jgi:hypothetical protein